MTRSAPPPDLGIAFLPSYCPRCQLSGCQRVDTVTCEWALYWPGGSADVTTAYVCDRCGCAWRDTWPCRYLLEGTDELTQ
ncbi:hypothetical protein [Nocardia brasiliensis]|uniref:hypothetical protein n=1 Tax=Nocardia brasiliensis TaxID=37326 RepID=UPI0004A7455F|nr:hypothetical protein [Nocardia brasiliensis]